MVIVDVPGMLGVLGAAPPAAAGALPAVPDDGAAVLAPPDPARLLGSALPLFARLPLAPAVLPVVLGVRLVDRVPPVDGVSLPLVAGSVVVAPWFVSPSPLSEHEPQMSPPLDTAATKAICVNLIIFVTSPSSTQIEEDHEWTRHGRRERAAGVVLTDRSYSIM